MKMIQILNQIANKDIKPSFENPFLIRYKEITYAYTPHLDWFDNIWKVGFICEGLDENIGKELIIDDMEMLNDEIEIVYDNRCENE